MARLSWVILVGLLLAAGTPGIVNGEDPKTRDVTERDYLEATSRPGFWLFFEKWLNATDWNAQL